MQVSLCMSSSVYVNCQFGLIYLPVVPSQVKKVNQVQKEIVRVHKRESARDWYQRHRKMFPL